MSARPIMPYLLAGSLAAAVVGVLAGPGPDAETQASLAAASGVPAAPTQRAAGQLTAAVTAAQDSPFAPVASGGITLAFGGDVHFEGVVRSRLSADPGSVLGAVAGQLRAADVAVVNLETPVTERGTPAAKQFVFRAPASAFLALRSAGVDAVTVANNHGLDYGEPGLADTLTAGRAAGVAVVGGGRDEASAFAPFVATVRGQRIALIGATQVLDDQLAEAWSAGPAKPGLASAKHLAVLLRAVREARHAYDTVVVYLHWGRELAGCPTADQRTLAAQLAAAGADVVVGSHAHVTLGAGYLGHTYVDYGLGNLAFYTHSADATARAGVLTLTVRGHAVTGAVWRPTIIVAGAPVPLTGFPGREATRAHDRQRACTGLAASAG